MCFLLELDSYIFSMVLEINVSCYLTELEVLEMIYMYIVITN